MKITGGLTRGRGMGETERIQWLLSMPACIDVNSAMQEFTDTNFVTSDQHKDMTDARLKRDDKGTKQLLGFIQNRNPFSPNVSLRNIVSGITADNTVNADDATDDASEDVKSMACCNALDYTLRRKQVDTTCQKLSASVDGEPIHVDPQLLFQRLVTAARGVTEHVGNIFKYELCTLPSSMFEAFGLLRQANKSALAAAI
ncbi:uncharacterized protein LOC121367282 [Gigantopelta aegis]|uniref:uncharacterized protein LOC121367282 n=1 Tax=Gigantopelta aegis TaxID=1735272 RepID=UPI001B88C2E1|nr:uncharacterized protein LOC121367282 [Gigantopelta aegis]